MLIQGQAIDKFRMKFRDRMVKDSLLQKASLDKLLYP